MPTRPAAALLLVLAICIPGILNAEQAAPVALSDSIGPDIDPAERSAYGLFPDLEDFESARFLPRGEGYRLEYITRDGAPKGHSRTRRISKEAFELTRWHVELTDAFRAAGRDSVVTTMAEAGWLRRLALRYASDRRYDAGLVLVRDLRSRYPATEEGAWADRASPEFEALAKSRAALFWPGALLDQRGRTDLLVFSGYYGLWVGTAIPAALGAEDEASYAAGIMLVPLASVLTTSAVTRDARVTEGTASLISLGGLLGTWQGLGWASTGDADGEVIVASGLLAGLGGVALAIPIAGAADITEGHGEIMHSAMWWGGWFGAVAGVLLDHDDTQDNGVLPDMLIGSDAAVAIGAVAGSGARLSRNRMRLINLCGVLGGVFGAGLSLLVEDPGEEAVMALIGGGSAAGLGLGVNATRKYDHGKDLSSLQFIDTSTVASSGRSGPTLRLGAVGPGRSNPGPRPGLPRLGIHVTF